MLPEINVSAPRSHIRLSESMITLLENQGWDLDVHAECDDVSERELTAILLGQRQEFSAEQLNLEEMDTLTVEDVARFRTLKQLRAVAEAAGVDLGGAGTRKAAAAALRAAVEAADSPTEEPESQPIEELEPQPQQAEEPKPVEAPADDPPAPEPVPLRPQSRVRPQPRKGRVR